MKQLVREWWEVVRLGYDGHAPYYCGAHHRTREQAREYVRRALAMPHERGVRFRVIRVRRWRHSSHVVGQP